MHTETGFDHNLTITLIYQKNSVGKALDLIAAICKVNNKNNAVSPSDPEVYCLNLSEKKQIVIISFVILATRTI